MRCRTPATCYSISIFVICQIKKLLTHLILKKMNIALITGSAGLVGSEAVEFFSKKFDLIVGIDNNMRSYFFGDEASTEWNNSRLRNEIPNYKSYNKDIREFSQLEEVFKEFGNDIKLVVHTAAQPSHDWAAKEPLTDFSVNAQGTLILLEATRRFCPEAPFVFTSTNKVYGDTPNRLPVVELESRFELPEDHPYFGGIPEDMSIDG